MIAKIEVIGKTAGLDENNEPFGIFRNVVVFDFGRRVFVLDVVDVKFIFFVQQIDIEGVQPVFFIINFFSQPFLKHVQIFLTDIEQIPVFEKLLVKFKIG